jgi:hypothetical protein
LRLRSPAIHIANGFEIVEVAEATSQAAGGLDDAVDRFDGSGGDALRIIDKDAVPAVTNALSQPPGYVACAGDSQ